MHGLNIEHYPFLKEEMTIDVDATKKKIEDMTRDGRAPRMGHVWWLAVPVSPPGKRA